LVFFIWKSQEFSKKGKDQIEGDKTIAGQKNK